MMDSRSVAAPRQYYRISIFTTLPKEMGPAFRRCASASVSFRAAAFHNFRWPCAGMMIIDTARTTSETRVTRHSRYFAAATHDISLAVRDAPFSRAAAIAARRDGRFLSDDF